MNRQDGSTKGCVQVLCGLPASGKSTLATQIQKHAGMVMQGDCHVFLIQYDAMMPPDVEQQLIQQSVEKGGSSWKSVRGQILSCVDCLLNNILQYNPESNDIYSGSPVNSSFHSSWDKNSTFLQEQGSNCLLTRPSSVDEALWYRFVSAVTDSVCTYRKFVIERRETYPHSWLVLIDDNMPYSSMRYEYCQLARKYEIGFCIVYVSCCLEEVRSRNAARSENKVTDHVIITMLDKFEIPDAVKRPWEKHSLTASGEATIDLHLLLDLAREAALDPQRNQPEEDEEEKDVSRFICSTNIIHQADQILRRCLSLSMAKAKGEGRNKQQLQRLAADLSHHRMSILEGMRKGDIKLPFDPSKPFSLDASKDSSSRLFTFLEQLFLSRCQNVA